jgi:hypothetical protein
LFANRLLARMKVILVDVIGPFPKILSVFRGNALSIAVSFGLIRHIRGLDRFSGRFNLTIRLSKSMSDHSSRFASPHRIAVSLSN